MSKSRGRKSLDERLNKRFTRRALLLVCVQASVTAGLAARLYQLQVVESERYNVLSDRNRIRPRLIPPVRGEIFDRHGAPLAENRQNYRVTIISEHSSDVGETLDRLGELIDLPETRRKDILADIRKKPRFIPVTVAENLSWDEFARINANAPALEGAAPELGWTRHYPHGFDTAHAVGYVGAFSDNDRNRADAQAEILSHPGMRIGKTGAERVHEALLRGEAGLRRVEVNALGREITELHRHDGLAGADLTLTLDLDLQKYAVERLGGETGAAVVMNVRDGDIMAMASTPTFNPNLFIHGISQTDWSRLREHPEKPMNNRALSGAYPPGSTFKMMVGMAGLEAGVITNNFSTVCGGKLRVGNRDFHCWRRGGHGRMNLHTALKNSCDVYFYEVARKVGIDKIAEVANAFGLGVRPEIDFPALSRGLMPTIAWKRAHLDAQWQVGDTVNASIGQGYVTATPLQLALMTARIANGGLMVNPRLIRAVRGEEQPVAPLRKIDMSASSLEAVKRGMFAVVNETGGTAYRSRINVDGSQMAGKTGTSQVRNISRLERESGVRSNDELERRKRDHALFVAYAPVEQPRLAASVVIEHGGSGSGAAAPVARDILLRALFGDTPPDGATAAVYSGRGRLL